MIFADTGYLLALSQPRDSLHERSKAWARVVGEPLLVTEYVLWETVNSLSKLADRPRAHGLVNHVRSASHYEIVAGSAALFDAGLRLQAERPDKEWSLTDCISFIVMEQQGIRRALAHDHHFEQAGFEALLRRDPP